MKLIVLAWAVLACNEAAAAAETTRIGGHVYAFPPAVFEGGQVESGPVGDMLIELAWPEMRPLTPAEASAWPRRATVRVLANSGAQIAGDAVPDSKLLAEIPLRLNSATDVSGGIVARATGHVSPPRPDGHPVAVGDAVPGGGMGRVQVEPPAPGDVADDVFTVTSDAEPRRFIECSRLAPPVVNPACKEETVFANMVLEINYPRALVPDWRAIETKVIGFIQAHEVRS